MNIIHDIDVVLTAFILVSTNYLQYLKEILQTNNFRGLSPRPNYTDRATAACRQS
jgi:hypothetical protein